MNLTKLHIPMEANYFKGNILIVDDTILNLHLLTQILDNSGYFIRAVKSGAEAIEAVAYQIPDLILLDINMPDMDGFEVCSLLKADAKTEKIPIIFISALSNVADKIKAFDVGGIDYIIKPFHPEEVIARVNAHIKIHFLEVKTKEQALKLEEINSQLTSEIKEHKRLNSELSLSENKFRGIFELSANAKTLTSVEGKFLKINHAFADMLGYTIEDMLKIHFKEITHPDDVAESVECIRSLLANEKDAFCFEKRYIHKNGSIIFANINTTLISDENGVPLYFLTSISNITARKKAEVLLSNAMQFNTEILAQLHEGIAVYNKDLRFEFWNTFLEELSGLTFNEVKGKTTYEVIPKLLQYDIESFINQALLGANVTTHALPYYFVRTRRKGYVIISYTPHYNSKNEIIGVIANVIDITERVQNEKKVKELQQLSQSTIDSLNANICVLNEQGVIISVNKKWLEFAEINNGVLTNLGIGINYIDMCNTAIGKDSDLAIQFGKGIHSVLHAESDLFEMEYPCHSESELRWFLGSVTPIVDAKTMLRKVVITHENITEKKLAAIKLIKSEEQYRLVAEKTSDVIWLMDLKGQSIYVSPSIEAFTGYTPEEYLTQTIATRFEKGSAKIAIETFTHEIKQFSSNIEELKEYSMRLELEYLCKDGYTKWGELIITPYFDNALILQGIHGVTRDITDRRKIENELKEVITEYYSLTDQLPAIVYRRFVGKESETILYNNMFETILGFEKDIANYCLMGDGILWMPIINLDAAEIENEMQNLLNKNGEYKVTYQVASKNGEIKYLLDKGVGVFAADKTLKYVEGVIFDISKEKEAEIELQYAKDNLDILVQKRTAELESSNNFNHALIQNVPLGMIMIDEHETILFISDKLKSMLSVNTIIGEKCYECFRDDTSKCINCPNKSEVEIGETIIVESSDLFGGRTMRIFHTALLYQGKKVFLNVYEDITEMQRLNDEIKASLAKEKELNLLKSRFISVVSHEFRTPMAGILSSIQLLERFGEKWDAVKKEQMYKSIRGAINYTNLLLDDVSLVGKDDSGKLEYSPELVNIKEFANQIVDEISLAYNVFDTVDITMNLSNDEFLLDAHLLRHILNNIISNSIKYNVGFASVDFTINQLDAHVLQFVVTDHGIGIPAEDLPHIFETFHRANNVEAIKGTGLGLSVVKRCAELHNGTVSIDSTLNVGTTVSVTIAEIIEKQPINDEYNL